MKRVLRGKVISNKAEKTITVLVERTKKHPLYRKNYTASTKFLVHDEKNEGKVGNLVDITESRPLSSKKRWVLTHIVTAKEMEK